MPYFDRDGLQFHFRDEGDGLPFVFQHGLGSDLSQTLALLAPPLPGLRLLGFDARAHGETRPVGDEKAIAFATSADDLAAFLDARGVERAVIGGISMGAAIALNFATRFPRRVQGLILARPAWLDRPLPENVRVFVHIAEYLLRYGPTEGLAQFRARDEFRAFQRDAPDAAQTIINQFEHPRALECVARLERIPNDFPSPDRAEWHALRVPTLVLANDQDPIHPRALAETLARTIPGALLKTLTSKSVSLDQHAADLRRHVRSYFRDHFNVA